ncbi:muskelin [Culicoides brevitarsis]|uniref:muskelin n=1 Tax=Culicoides brevitarsis TaxID=469753 RepID=UPI00307CB7BB
MDVHEIKKLEYDIHKYTSYSTTYLPENIREDQSTNQTSRWSSNSNNPPQYLILKLQRPSIVKKIKFGKYEKAHVCNLRKFKIFGGLEESCGVLLLEGGLKNDPIPEVFDLRYRTSSGELLPVRYIKILPLLSWGPCFNFSIWYVELLGNDDAIYVSTSLKSYNIEREAEIIRLCLKYFRQQGYERAFDALQDQTNVQLEHPTIQELHNNLVTEGDFAKTEAQIERLIDEGLMDEYLARQPYSVSWKSLNTESNKWPGKRGGHQLVLDPKNQLMYLYGGWNGSEDLSDLWVFDIKTNQWELIHENSELVGGPSPRACHKMVFDTHNSQIFMIGKYIESSSRVRDKLKSDFYLYDTETRTWLLICDDTKSVGGPDLVYDHQLAIDSAKRTIYVFGGRILTASNTDELSSDQFYSGLYAYHISNNVWNLLLVDCAHPRAAFPEVNSIKSRITHSMLFHDKNRKLFIFGGQRGKEYMGDFITYDVDTQEVTNLISDNSNVDAKNGPPSGLTQRATIDTDRNEIYVLTSLSKGKDRRGDMDLNSLWMFSLNTLEWSCIYRSDENKEQSPSSPCPRYAHTLVFDPASKIHYLFGGNPGITWKSNFRLDDFWCLYMRKPSRENALQRCRYLIRTQEYEELAKKDPLRGLTYLQTKLHAAIDRENPDQVTAFHKLATLLFKLDDPAKGNASPCSSSMSGIESPASSSMMSPSCSNEMDLYAYNIDQVTQITNRQIVDLEVKRGRYSIYNKIIEFLPQKMCQPKANLTDFILV